MLDGRIYCLVERDSLTTVNDLIFDLRNDKHHILLAGGTELHANSIGLHTIRAASDDAISLVLDSPADDVLDVYNGCGTDKTCFGYPRGCISTENCALFGAVIYENEKFLFEMLSAREYVVVRNSNVFNSKLFKLETLTCLWAYQITIECRELQ